MSVIPFSPSSAPVRGAPFIDMRDSQRGRVYQWERDCLHLNFKKKASVAQLTELLRGLCEVTGIPLRARFSNIEKDNGSLAYYQPDSDGFFLISFDPHYGRTPEMAVHEFAHIVVHQESILFHEANGTMVERSCHGPQWLTVYMYLLIHCLGYDRNYLISTANLSGLKFFEHAL